MGAIDRWRRLGSRDRALVVRVLPVVLAAAARLHIGGIRNVLAWSQPPVGRGVATASDDLVLACERVGRYVPGATCLPRSAALSRMLRKRGVPAIVRIGVSTDPGFAAHAWVEIEGAPRAASPARFTPLAIR